MKSFASTAILSLLIQKGLLSSRLEWLGLKEAPIAFFLTKLQRETILPLQTSPINFPIDPLIKHGLLYVQDSNKIPTLEAKKLIRKNLLSLAFVRAVNFELTYQCNMVCPHCLQINLRSLQDKGAIDLPLIFEIIEQIWFTGLIEGHNNPRTAINFTGGEVLFSYSGIFELIKYAHTLNLNVRLNTNSWWGNKQNFTVDGYRFTSPQELVRSLKDCGLTVLALSYDRRFDEEPEALNCLAGSMFACGQGKLPYEVICTGRNELQKEQLLSQLRHKFNIKLPAPFPWISMEEVDIGNAAEHALCIDEKDIQTDLIHLVARGSNCNHKGFYLPSFLHINPYGGVRSCLYASGLSNMGDITNSNLYEIINRFPSDPVSKAFKENTLKTFAERLFIPFAKLYRSFNHPCTACAVISRLIEETSKDRKAGEILEVDLEKINLKIAREMNLAKGIGK